MMCVADNALGMIASVAGYILFWASYCLLAGAILVLDRKTLLPEWRNYFRFLFVPWKLAIFAPALLFVACLMTRGLVEVDWDDVTEYAPAVVTAIAMPLTFSIANGIAFGFISYAAIKLLAGRFGDVRLGLIVLAALFVVKFAVL